jgi:hypothetical protein
MGHGCDKGTTTNLSDLYSNGKKSRKISAVINTDFQSIFYELEVCSKGEFPLINLPQGLIYTEVLFDAKGIVDLSLRIIS